MKPGRASPLLQLQRGLHVPSTALEQPGHLDLLSFEAAQRRWTIPCADVSHVSIPSDFVRLAGYPQLPAHVVGAVGTDSEMLSVVDAGLLLGVNRTHISLKSRLIAFSNGDLKGIALLVSRVLERASSAWPADASLQHLSPASLYSRIAATSNVPKEAQ